MWRVAPYASSDADATRGLAVRATALRRELRALCLGALSWVRFRGVTDPSFRWVATHTAPVGMTKLIIQNDVWGLSLLLRDGREDEADTADDEVRWHFVWPESEQLHGMAELDRTKDEAIVFKFREPELQSVADAHGEDRGLRPLIGDGRVVVAVDDRDGVRRQHGLHAGGLQPRDTHGDEARPSTPRGGSAGAHLLENAKRQLHSIERCRAGRYGIVDGDTGYHNGNSSMGERCLALHVDWEGMSSNASKSPTVSI